LPAEWIKPLKAASVIDLMTKEKFLTVMPYHVDVR
jgi:hypothetical protein